MERKKYKAYKCFSNNQKEFLMSKGCEYITIALDPTSKDLFWLFLRDDLLSNALDEWEMIKKQSYSICNV